MLAPSGKWELFVNGKKIAEGENRVVILEGTCQLIDVYFKEQQPEFLFQWGYDLDETKQGAD